MSDDLIYPGEPALDYAARGWPGVFPCHWDGERRKRPLTAHGLHDASRDPDIIIAWWRRWPYALIGVPTGTGGGFVVLDVDVKDDRANGYDSLEELGRSILPDTWLVHTASGGLHIYFDPGEREIRNTAGKLGRGLDVRGNGGYVIVPSPGSGYWWDPHWNPDTAPLAPVPAWLIAVEPERSASVKPVKPENGLSNYAEGALDAACRNIIAAPAGEQEITVNGESFSIGRFAGAGGIPVNFARRALIWSARQMPNHDPRRPWRQREIEDKVDRAFGDGLRHPREVRDA